MKHYTATLTITVRIIACDEEKAKARAENLAATASGLIGISRRTLYTPAEMWFGDPHKYEAAVEEDDA